MALYLIGTPIGNLKDITLRALELLNSSPLVLVEKWSDSIKLLNHYKIKPEKIATYDDRNCRRITSRLIEELKEKDAAFITSAGMPGVSDPGAYLVRACREAGIEVIPIPGPSSLSTALSVCGFDPPFLFVGFLSKKASQIAKTFEIAASGNFNLIFFESTFRLEKTLKFLEVNYPLNLIFIGKEMTKKFENYEIGYPKDFLEKIKMDKNFTRGEFVIVANFVE
ncbi:MAG: ribosomal RNA small subunit methyltransferase I [Candidatus Paceibacterota bacterium]|jgi:16S rRNA (cytidine1402-2'-O)-methyltransferase